MIAALAIYLTDACPGLVDIQEVSAFDALGRPAYPVATLHIASERPDEAMLCGPATVRRRLAVTVTARGSDALLAARAELRAALMSYGAPNLLGPPRFQEGALLAISEALLQWRDHWDLVVAL